MRGKRSKQYRKLMRQYGMSFGFREPYQVLVDADMIRDADRFKMDLVAGLERTLQGQVKPTSEPGASYLIDKAKLFERRRCGHRPEDYHEPLSTQECLSSVVDPKDSKTNKHRYVVASQDLEVRKYMRGINGVPLVYINRSVMIIEPMAGSSAAVREREERRKFRDGLKRGSGSLKRKREEDDGTGATEAGNEDALSTKKTKYKKGPKEPNPLAIKKPKREVIIADTTAKSLKVPASVTGGGSAIPEPSDLTKRKRKRKHKSGIGNATATEQAVEGDE
ncbi:hypothetical protein B7494_g1164 [Chlorociboria aeruginascens]|nr:hypothetical protein B7494_g1164 [Chlorociboria aeruginascens]